ncbi:MAG: hypothetical protein AWU58_1698 [Methanohalophilus sp. T328-1]|jgi:hypothetical protein|uniref:Uncharacterized protein n=1 Tax=Methanohalophilus euhalobius TaxID=51203 RepID=A0A285GDP9_9EURY|nr:MULTISPECIES: hypothetical protein [Methanohalophilus]KXS41518.1 MAG: hypothetical protein AWU58_1698 [Methanohalophilus sp. T328-1]RSD33449.1 MAG: hypothetical protein CI952_1560 [Methanohalophilus sp.]OBZ34315.1 MAG: hypothetical protein A9957_03665 [Methanohalophilus sp. DAL1]ODV48857.1 MAG: hypothetical protein A8273_1869 [Methanohalophilus sp. 2-GBenrich]RXG33500.1 hypothetical protein CI957_1812 [Methanohalophilus sp. WG1-DM]
MSNTSKLPTVHSIFDGQIGAPTCKDFADLPRDEQSKRLEEMARKATTRAAKDALENGRSITFQQGNAIVRKHPDGRIEVLKTLENAFVTPKKRVYKI